MDASLELRSSITADSLGSTAAKAEQARVGPSFIMEWALKRSLAFDDEFRAPRFIMYLDFKGNQIWKNEFWVPSFIVYWGFKTNQKFDNELWGASFIMHWGFKRNQTSTMNSVAQV